MGCVASTNQKSKICENLEPPERSFSEVPWDPTAPISQCSTNPARPQTKRVRSSHLLELVDACPIRRDSQCAFGDRNQTLVVFDWDDTLFPTHFTRMQHRINSGRSEDGETDTPLTPATQKQYTRMAEKVTTLLERALELAHVVIVTLAREPWVEISCNSFFKQVGKCISDHDIKVVYALELGTSNKSKFATEREYLTSVKQHAIQNEARTFYSSYEGQSWKNLISIGDSVYERDAMQITTQEYSIAEGLQWQEKCCFEGIDRNNHYRKIRAKTVKMMEDPLISDLCVEVELLTGWLPNIIQYDGGFSIDLEQDKMEEEFRRLIDTTGTRESGASLDKPRELSPSCMPQMLVECRASQSSSVSVTYV